ncbi:hypothetical protein IHE45_14G086200 [Dioscorea alata]|uniref:Uncharacterized protein n=1 Tax=Dioscorea alata TaxID=55571 RepID=A0ACB7UT33_DIOAL|nr:hypothetical protein IHE45_14G086200 [Dioscorea alata]
MHINPYQVECIKMEMVNSTTSLTPFTPKALHEHYTVRQAFLKSYQFTVRESFGEKLWRGFREFNKMGKAAIVQAFHRISGRVPAMRSLKCFSPSSKDCCLEDF